MTDGELIGEINLKDKTERLKEQIKCCHKCDFRCNEVIQALLQLSDALQMLLLHEGFPMEYKSNSGSAYMIIYNEIFDKCVNKKCINIVL